MSDISWNRPDTTGSTQQSFTRVQTTPDTRETSEQMRFARLALFTGGPLYWSTPTFTPGEHTYQLMALVQWCLELPGVRVGINPQGIAQIVASLILQGKMQLTDEISRKFSQLTIIQKDVTQWPFDDEYWGEHFAQLSDWLLRSNSTELLWVTADEARWWVEATGRSILQYSVLPQRLLDPNLLLNLLGRHSCILFGPYDDSGTRARLRALAVEQNRPDVVRSLDQSDGLTDPRIASVCWSWNLLSFGNVGERSLALTPEFTLWSDWPLSPIRAPARPESHPVSASFTAQEAADFLEDQFWTTIESLFGLARSMCGVGVSSPTFAGRQARAPVFYFAFPEAPPTRPEDYLNNRAGAIQPITDRCLLAQDPFSDQVGWGVLQGSVVAMRSESVMENAYALWYLLLPTLAKNSSGRQIEEIVGAAVGRLSYLEFSIGHEGRDVSTDLEQYQNRRALYAGSLDSVGEVIAQAIDLIPTGSRRLVEKINKFTPGLLRLMLRMQANAEKVQSDTVQLQLRYQAYMDGTEDFIRRGITFSPLANEWLLSLRAAVLHAYPYAYIEQPLKSQAVSMEEVGGQIERSIEALNVFSEQAELHAREQLTRWGTVFGVLIIVVTLLGAFSQIFSGGPVDNSQIASLLNGAIPVPLLESILRVVGALALAAFVVAVVSYMLALLRHYLPSRPPKFFTHLVRYRALVDQAVTVARERTSAAPKDVGSRLERIDTQSTKALVDLWQDILEVSDPVRGSAFNDWKRRERRLEYNIQLFDLSPEMIPLPRTLCILRFKSAELRRYSMVPDWDWISFLGTVGIDSDEARQLTEWLSAPVVADQVGNMDVATFASVLKAHGVSADPALRTPDKWTGSLL